MKSVNNKMQARPIARVYFAGEDSPYPGWFVQRYVAFDLLTTRLPLVEGADAFEAVAKAAEFLGCARDRIQVEGANWPRQANTA